MPICPTNNHWCGEHTNNHVGVIFFIICPVVGFFIFVKYDKFNLSMVDITPQIQELENRLQHLGDRL